MSKIFQFPVNGHSSEVKKSEFGKLQSQGECGMYDVLPATKPVVFTHHARRYVYRYDDCSRSIDVLYDRSICIFERALQARTEQAVYDEHVFVKSGWDEFVDDFM